MKSVSLLFPFWPCHLQPSAVAAMPHILYGIQCCFGASWRGRTPAPYHDPQQLFRWHRSGKPRIGREGEARIWHALLMILPPLRLILSELHPPLRKTPPPHLQTALPPSSPYPHVNLIVLAGTRMESNICNWCKPSHLASSVLSNCKFALQPICNTLGQCGDDCTQCHFRIVRPIKTVNNFTGPNNVTYSFLQWCLQLIPY